jgi:hypothetical protein
MTRKRKRRTEAQLANMQRDGRCRLETREAEQELREIAKTIRSLVSRIEALTERSVALEAQEFIWPMSVNYCASRTVLPAIHELLAAVHKLQGNVVNTFKS